LDLFTLPPLRAFALMDLNYASMGHNCGFLHKGSFPRRQSDSDLALVSDDFAQPLPQTRFNSAALPTPTEMVANSWRGGETHHRVGQTRGGQWWWFDPVDGARVIAGVQGVNRSLSAAPIWPQLQEWGFNLLGFDAAEGVRNCGAAFLQALELRRATGYPIYQDGVNLPDVFDRRWEGLGEQLVNGVRPTASLAGYLGDSALSWGDAAVEGVALARPALLQVCLSLDPSYAAYHAAWEFVFAERAGKLTRLNTDWGMALPNKEALRQMTREETPIDTPGYRVDLDRFTRQMALRYFGAVSRILRAVDPGRLWLSSPLARTTPVAVREIAAQHCDVSLVTEVGLSEGIGPELLVEVDWARARGLRSEMDPVGMGDFERMIWRGRESLLSAIRAPQVVGYIWGHYGAGDWGRDGAFTSGLLDEAGRINQAHVPALQAINGVAAAVRAEAAG